MALNDLQAATSTISQAVQSSSDPNVIDERNKKLTKYSEKYNLKNRAKLRYDYSDRERSDTDTCIKKYANNKTEALEMLAKAYKNYPNSPYVLQEHILMLLIADQITDAESVFRKDSAKYPNQVGLEMIAEYLEKIKVAPQKQSRKKLISELNSEIRYLEMAITYNKFNKQW